MAKPIPNVPLEHCRKVIKACSAVEEHAKAKGNPGNIEGLMRAIREDLEALALEIQQDQSGEI